MIKAPRKRSWLEDFARNKYKYLIFLPVFIYLIIFCYKPMYGTLIAFQNYRPRKGIWGSEWVGLANFANFFGDYYFTRILSNTLLISFYSIVWGFPVPIIFALLLNEIRSTKYKRLVQTASYLPHFISLVVVCGLLKQFLSTEGLINDIIVMFGGTRTPLLQYPENFRTIYTASGVWQKFGWDSIIYFAAFTGIDPALYEAADIDGAGRFRKMLNITLPSIAPTIIMLFILRTGSVLSLGSEKVLLLYNEATYKTADIISTYTYRRGMINADYSYAAAVDLFNSLINLLFLGLTNTISKKVSEVSIF